MHGEHRRFEIVLHLRLPRVERTQQPIAERHGGHRRAHPGIGLARGDARGGFRQHERATRQVEGERLHPFAAARASLRAIAHEKRRIASQRGGARHQFRLGEPQTEQFVHGQHHGRGVGRSAAQPGAERHALAERDGHGSRGVALPHEAHGLHAEVVSVRTVDPQPQCAETILGGAHDLHLVVEVRDGHHHRIEVVVTVRPTPQHVETDIDFAVGFQQHDFVR